MNTEPCDICGKQTENGAGHFYDELQTEDRLCTACRTEYWSHYCEECGAEPEQPCADGCVNAHKGCLQ